MCCKQDECYSYTRGILRFAFVLKDSVTSRWCEGALLVFRSKAAASARGQMHLLTFDGSVPQRVRYQSVLLVFEIKTAVAMRGKMHFGYASKNAIASSWLPCMLLCLYFQTGRVLLLVITCTRHVLSKILFSAAVVRGCFACISKQNGFYH